MLNKILKYNVKINAQSKLLSVMSSITHTNYDVSENGAMWICSRPFHFSSSKKTYMKLRDICCSRQSAFDSAKTFRSFSIGKSTKRQHILEGYIDRYNGLWIDIESSGNSIVQVEEFYNILKESLHIWQDKKHSCVWLTVPINKGGLIEVASHFDFQFHHAEGMTAVLILCLNEDVRNKIPQYATHQIGVSGVAVKEETQEVLVVMDKNRKYKLWKFPGGLSDLGEDIAVTAVREVFEETGVHTEFQSILAFRQQHDHPNAFGRSDIYVICRLTPLTFDLLPCSEEIAAIKWVPIEQLLAENQASQMTHCIAGIVRHGLRHGFDTVDINSHEITSIYKKTLIQMFHRPWTMAKS